MKKLTALLLVLALTVTMTGCVREGPVETHPTQPPAPSEDCTEDQVYVEPDPTDRETTVRLLNHDPETDAVWRALAKEYTESTGIRVIAMTTASDVYEEVLTEQLRGFSPVTVFFSRAGGSLPVSCADLSGTAAYGALPDPSLALTADGQPVGLPFHTESFGLLVDTELLEKTGFTEADLSDLDGLTRVVRSVSERSGQLDFQAFAAPALGSPEAAQLLYTAAEGDADRIRPLWELAIWHYGTLPSGLPWTTSADTFGSFLNGQALLCLAYSRDLEAAEEGVRLLPIPTRDGAIVGLGCDGYWCVNGSASPADIQAGIEFLDWVLSENAETFEGRCLPYGSDALDPLTRQAVELDARRVSPMLPEADLTAELIQALTVYVAGPSETRWDDVRSVFRK